MSDIEKGRIFNHRDGMSELERFEMENDVKCKGHHGIMCTCMMNAYSDAKPMTAEERAD